jgi:gliding motility-associated-like protein
MSFLKKDCVPSLCATADPQKKRRVLRYLVLLVAALTLPCHELLAEGSKDFVEYLGYRMFLDTRDPQQMKVFARTGEFINVGSSHVGVQEGYINVYSPGGQLVATFDNTGAFTGKAIIHNSDQEMNGPTGGGLIQGPGYIPGVVQVQPGQEGVWTVVFDYPGYSNAGFNNIMNDQSWTRLEDQPNSRRVVLAWDVTVTSSGAGNEGGLVHEGRLFTNEYVSVINGIGYLTSPSFYVLTMDGYIYRVDIKDADPFRFPISSNSLGLVNANGIPIYMSKPESAFTRNANPSTWIPGNTYLYEPQARDNGALINNKIFFNMPDNSMPQEALATDIFRNDVHKTWLYSPLATFQLSQFGFQGAAPGGTPCAPGTMGFGSGGWFMLETNLGGSVTLQLDLNNNDTFGDPVDVTIFANLNEGLDSVFWDGADGTGVPLGLQDSLVVRLKGAIRYGELHIALTDVENNPGGVTFKWLNPLPNQPDSLFYYDHTDVGGPISFPLNGSPIPGVPQATTVPYKYTMNMGNEKYLDQWFFIEEKIEDDTIIISIVVDCVCSTASPDLQTASGSTLACEGSNWQTGVFNLFSDIPLDSLTYSWSGPAGQLVVQELSPADTSLLIFSPLSFADAGIWQVIAETPAGCRDTLLLEVEANPRPSPFLLSGDGIYCSGDQTVLSAVNTTTGIDSISFTWSGPSFFQSGTVSGGDTLSFSMVGLTTQNGGAYQLSFTSSLGCNSDSLSSQLIVNQTPQLLPISGAGIHCENSAVSFKAVNLAPVTGNLICTWSGPNFFTATQSFDSGDTIILSLTNVNSSFQGTYTVVCSSLGCPSQPVSFDLQVETLPEINGITPPGIYCPGELVVLTAQNSVPVSSTLNYTWTGPSPLLPYTSSAASPQGPFSVTLPSLAAVDTGQYCLVLETAAGCQSLSQCTTLDLYPELSIQILAEPVTCIGGDIELSAVNVTPVSSPVTYIWTGPQGGVVGSGIGAGAGPFDASVANAGISDAGTYVLTLSSINGCTATASVYIAVEPGISIDSTSGEGTYCQGADVTLSAVNNLGSDSLVYQWNGPGGAVYGPYTVGSFDPLSVFLENIGPAQEGLYQLSVVSAGGCLIDPITLSLSVHPDIQAVEIFQFGDFCQGQAGTVCAFSQQPSLGSFTYHFLLPDGSTQSVAGISGDTACVNLALEGTACVWLESSEGCLSDTTCADVTGLPHPVPVVQASATSLCEGEDLFLSGINAAIGSGEVTYTWFSPGGNVLFTGTAPWEGPFPAQVLNTSASQSGDYVLVVSFGDCTSDAQVIQINVNQAPQIDGTAIGGSFCEGASAALTFTVAPAGVAEVDWQVSGPNGFFQSGTTSSVATYSFDVQVNGTSAGDYSITAVSSQGCEADPLTISFEIENLPPLALSASADLLCATAELLLTSSSPGGNGVTYAWYFEGGLLETTTDSVFMVINPLAGSYQVVASVEGCETSSAELEVSQLPGPVAEDDLYEPGAVAAFSDNVLVNDLPQGAVTVEIIQLPVFGTLEIYDDGNFNYTPGSDYVVSDEFVYEICQVDCPDQCDQASVSLRFDVECLVPNVVTPNGDGANDLLEILCLETGDFPNNRFRVFNRWGSELIIFEPYLNNWDITYDTDKKPVPAGVYFYMLELDKNKGQQVITGYIKVVR